MVNDTPLPVVSAGALHTWRTDLASASADEARFAELRRHGALRVQPFLPAIESHGEWSLVFLGGEFSHAVRKWPAPGDFRVQTQVGGRFEPALPPSCSRLPSSRMLAADLALSRNTVELAFSQLDAEGLLERRMGSGLLVTLPEHVRPPAWLPARGPREARIGASRSCPRSCSPRTCAR